VRQKQRINANTQETGRNARKYCMATRRKNPSKETQYEVMKKAKLCKLDISVVRKIRKCKHNQQAVRN
jgi:hypothetical protein